jgi:hypothetical protein
VPAGSCIVSKVEGNPRKTWLLAVSLSALLAFSLKLALLLNTRGTNDVQFWERSLERISTGGALALYQEGAQVFRSDPTDYVDYFNQTPFMIHVLRLWGWAIAASGLPMGFWLRLTSSLADIGSLWLVWKILRPRPAPLLLVALSPVSIMVSGFHGNTDPVMIFFLLLSIYLLEIRGRTLLAGVAFGMAINIKVMPVVLGPAILLYLPSMKQRVEFTLGAAAAFTAGWMPYLAQAPLPVLLTVFGYNSISGHWGLSRLLNVYVLSTGTLPWLVPLYQRIGKALMLSVLLAASVWMNRRSKKPRLFLQWGFLAFLFLLLTPGFGVQYLAWLVPWGAALTGWEILFWYAASGFFLFEVYTYWSRGIPWYFANMRFTDDLNQKNGLLYFALETLCWISVACVVYAYWKRLGRRATSPDAE